MTTFLRGAILGESRVPLSVYAGEKGEARRETYSDTTDQGEGKPASSKMFNEPPA
jgi:hypothetical protein